MKVNIFELKNRIRALLAEYPELVDDEDVRLDTLEGETEIKDVLAIILEDIKEASSMQDAIALRIKDLKSRAERFVMREQGWRKLAQDLMQTANLRKVQLTEATLSIRATPPAVHIIDQTFLPEQFWRVKKEPNLSLIKETLKAGTDVPGAALSNSPDTLAILSK